MNRLVSILIPAYNSQRWIKETIESALSQTWSNKEVIIVDDGSTDDTLQIAKSYESKTLKVITQENRGAPSARNTALSNAQGDYIQWLDNDDLLDPDKISRQIEHSYRDQNPLILYSSPFGQFYYCTKRAKFILNSLWQDLSPAEYFLIKFTQNSWLQPGAWLVSRKLTELAGPYYELRSPDDDGEYFCRVVANCEKIRFVPDAKAYWRVGNFGSLSQKRSAEASEALFISMTRCIGHFLSFENSEKSRQACLQYIQNRLWRFYPDDLEILAKASDLAASLGGRLVLPPDEGHKFSMLMKFTGWKLAMFLRSTAFRAETYIRRNWDRFLYEHSLRK